MIRQRAFIARHRRSGLLLLALAALAVALALEHSQAGHGGVEAGDAGAGMAEAVSLCLAVLETLGASVGALALAQLARRRRSISTHSRHLRPPRSLVPVMAGPPPARAGPAALQVLRR